MIVYTPSLRPHGKGRPLRQLPIINCASDQTKQPIKGQGQYSKRQIKGVETQATVNSIPPPRSQKSTG